MNDDLISRSALRKAVNDFYDNSFEGIVSSDLIKYAKAVDELIGNAPTVEYPFYSEAYQTGYEEGKKDRPQAKTNADLFRQIFGMYATEIWSMSESQFLEWLNDEGRE